MTKGRMRLTKSKLLIYLLLLLFFSCTYWFSERISTSIIDEEEVVIVDVVSKKNNNGQNNDGNELFDGDAGDSSSSSSIDVEDDDYDDFDDDDDDDDFFNDDDDDETRLDVNKQGNDENNDDDNDTINNNTKNNHKDNDDHENSDDKTHLLKILQSSKIPITKELQSQLPTWSEITQMYTSQPIIYGQETCSAFQSSIPNEEAYIGIAGLQNTGTNLLHKLLYNYCIIPDRFKNYQKYKDDSFMRKTQFKMKWQRHGILPEVPWGKHKPLDKRGINVNEHGFGRIDIDTVLPVVIIKDPYTWMKSMCRHPYQVIWPHSKLHCPNLIPNDVDLELASKTSVQVDIEKDQPIPVHTRLMGYKDKSSKQGDEYNKKEVRTYESLIDFWNTWYTSYYKQTSFPFLMVRFEDIVYHTETIVKTVCTCAGGTLKTTELTGDAKDDENYPIHIQGEPVKSGGVHDFYGKVNGLVDTVIQYGNSSNRIDGLTEEDVLYAKDTIEKELMEAFGYKMP